MDDSLLKVEEVARQLNLSIPAVYVFARKGILPAIKIGRSVRFRQSSINNLLVNREKLALGKVA